MIAVWLVRHGEAAANWGEHPDPGLSELGKRQAFEAADALWKLVPADVAMVTSPKARAIETATPLAQRLASSVTVDHAFQEIQAPVDLEHRQGWLRGFMRSSWSEQSESLWEWRTGIIDSLLTLQRPTVIFTHFLVINTVLAHIRGADQTLLFWPDNGSFHQFGIDGDTFRVASLGREMATRIN